MVRALFTLCAVWSAFAQATPAVTPFEVVSIRPHQGPMRTLWIETSGPRVSWEAANLRMLVMYAYDLRNYQVAGSIPLLTGDDRFTILAKAEGDGARSQYEFRLMTRLLLAERFKLKFHRETRETPVYALVVAKNRPKMKPGAPEAEPIAHYSFLGTNNIVTCPKADMETVLNAVKNGISDRPVLDHTGLTGTYELRLVYTPESRRVRETEPDPNDISIFTAVQEQLGLKLEPRKEAIEVLVVDAAEKPVDN
jgi:uncharacterized protein (TIGR03435 family)